jgi:hypothetical protein
VITVRALDLLNRVAKRGNERTTADGENHVDEKVGPDSETHSDGWKGEKSQRISTWPAAPRL